MNGVIVVDKPPGWTSHDVVNRMRRLAGTKKVGHLGTLDPMATGVLPLVLNRATRLAQYFVKSEKVYEGEIRFGWSTDSYDADGEPTSERREVTLAAEELDAVFERFRGAFAQTPPPVSAKKVQGRPAYVAARKKQTVDLAAVDVIVHELRLLRVEGATATVRVHCSAGTYVRSIAHDAGQILGCGAFLASLRRTAAGPFDLSQARTLEALAALADAGRIAEALVPAAQLLPEFPLEVVDQITETQIRQGRDFRVSPFRARDGVRFVKAVNRDGELIAIGEARLPNVYHPVLVL